MSCDWEKYYGTGSEPSPEKLVIEEVIRDAGNLVRRELGPPFGPELAEKLGSVAETLVRKILT